MKIKQTEYDHGKPATRKVTVDGHVVDFTEDEEPDVPHKVGKYLLQFDRYEKVENSSETEETED